METEPHSMKKIGRWFLVILGLIIALTITSKFQMFGGRGQVLDSSSNNPVEGATVNLDCRRSLFHGSKSVRQLATKSDTNGWYDFSLFDVIGCNFAFVHVAKDGYISSTIHPRYVYDKYSQIPKYRFLTKDSDSVMLRLQAITPHRTAEVYPQTNSVSYYSKYRDWYKRFFEAKNIANTAQEKKFIVRHYCESLVKLYTALNEQEIVYLSELKFSFRWRGKTFEDAHDHEAVVTYCTGWQVI